MRTESAGRGPLLVKTVAALIVIAVGGWLIWGWIGDSAPSELESSAPPRGQILIATRGGDRDYTVHTRTLFATDNTAQVVFFVNADGVDYNNPSTVMPIEMQIVFIGSVFAEGVACGASTDPTPRQPVDVLEPGVKNGIAALAGTQQQTGNTSSGPAPVRSEQQDQYPVFESTVWSTHPTWWSDKRSPRDSGGVWSETCTLPESAIWRETTDDASRRSLLLPRLGFTSIADASDFQTGFVSEAYSFRRDGWLLSESYPEATAMDNAWYFNQPVYWRGSLGETSNVGYTDQPTLVFSNQGREEGRDLRLMWAGAALGVIAALAVNMGSGLIDLGFRPRKHNGATEATTDPDSEERDK